MKFRVLGVDHLGIACADLESGSAFWEGKLGVKKTGQETVESQKVADQIGRASCRERV